MIAVHFNKKSSNTKWDKVKVTVLSVIEEHLGQFCVYFMHLCKHRRVL